MGFAIGFAIYLVLLLFVNTEDLIKHLEIYPWGLLVPVILLKFMSWLFRFWEWQYFLGVIEARDKISLFDSFVLFISGFTMAVSPGKAAEVLKSFILRAKTGVPVAKSAPVVIAERVVDGLAVIILAFLALLLAGDEMALSDEYRALIFLATGLLVGGLIVVQMRPVVHFFLNWLNYLPILRRAYSPLMVFYESSREIFKLKHVIPTTLMGFVASVGDAVGFAIILSGFGLELTWLLVLQSSVIVSLAAAIGALSGVPNGAGITEVSVSLMVMALVAPGNPLVTGSVAETAALIEGFFHKWFRVLVGLLVALIFRSRLFPPELEDILEEEHQASQFPAEAEPTTSA